MKMKRRARQRRIVSATRLLSSILEAPLSTEGEPLHLKECSEVNMSATLPETLEALQSCTTALKAHSLVLKDAQGGSLQANEKFAQQYKELLALVDELRDTEEIATAFDADQEDALHTLVEQTSDLEGELAGLK